MPTADERTDAGKPAGREQKIDHRMMWVMMVGCCLAVPLAFIIGGAGVGGLVGASPWLVSVGIVLAVALVVVRRRTGRTHCETPPERHVGSGW